MSINIKQVKVGFISAISGGLLFGLVCAIFHINDLHHLSLAVGVGAFSGLVAAPEFSPKTYKKPKLFQTVSGALSGLLLGVLLKWNIEWVGVSVIIGAALGYTAKYWVDHVQIP